MTEQREGWALTSNGRSYRKVTGVRQHSRGWNQLTSKERAVIPSNAFFDAAEFTEREVFERCVKNVQLAVEKARKQLANAERDEARLLKRAKEMEA